MVGYRRMVAVYSAAHFFVDLACAFLVFRYAAGSPDWPLCLLLYNFCAFALQMPLGVLAGRLDRNRLTAAAGCAVVAASYALIPVPLAAATVAGLGNAFFHLGGGIEVMNARNIGALGIFVSPGALGIYSGTALGKGSGAFTVPVLLTLLAAAVLIWALCRAGTGGVPLSPLGGPSARLVLPAAAVLFCVVALRSYTGLAMSFPWRGDGHWGLVLLFAVFLGKAAGGFIAARLGWLRTGLCALGAAAVLLCFPSLPIAGTAGMLTLNITMPVTLFAAGELFPNAKGFAFGLLTFALFIGFLPAQYL